MRTNHSFLLPAYHLTAHAGVDAAPVEFQSVTLVAFAHIRDVSVLSVAPALPPRLEVLVLASLALIIVAALVIHGQRLSHAAQLSILSLSLPTGFRASCCQNWSRARLAGGTMRSQSVPRVVSLIEH